MPSTKRKGRSSAVEPPRPIEPPPASVRLREYRSQHYPTIALAARAMGMNMTTLSHHETGRRRISPEAAASYALEFGVDAGDILFGPENLRKFRRQPPLILVVGSLGDDGLVVSPETSAREAAMSMVHESGLHDVLKWRPNGKVKATITIIEPPPPPEPPPLYVLAPLGMTQDRANGLGSITVTTDAFFPLFLIGDNLIHELPDLGHPAPLQRLERERCVVYHRDGSSRPGLISVSDDGTVTQLAGPGIVSDQPLSEVVAVCPIVDITRDRPVEKPPQQRSALYASN